MREKFKDYDLFIFFDIFKQKVFCKPCSMKDWVWIKEK